MLVSDGSGEGKQGFSDGVSMGVFWWFSDGVCGLFQLFLVVVGCLVSSWCGGARWLPKNGF